MRGFGVYFELHVTCRGEPDPETGYFINITEIDRAVREAVLPRIHEVMRRDPSSEPAALLPELIAVLQPHLRHAVHAVSWQLTPYHSITMTVDDPAHVLLRQQFEFAAAHRLHCPDRSEEENRAIFGKCNNPNGHGHNYRIETAVRVPIAAEGRPMFDVLELERIVDRVIITRFDHTNLDMDTSEFAGMNSSVEHIVRVCYDLLAPAFAEAGVELETVTVWETGKTSCSYPVRSAAR